MNLDIQLNRVGSSNTSIGVKSPACDVVVIGAGPYGLSAAAHLTAKGLSVSIFGEPMEFWARRMPEGMLLRSPRVASNISDPKGALSLDAYEAAMKIAPCAPLPLDTFVDYGKWFRAQLSCNLDERLVALVEQDESGFKITTQDGEKIHCKQVIVAAGIGPFRRKPSPFSDVPSDRISHCYEGRKLSQLADKKVAVIGAGQSALESAALLHELGADVEMIARSSMLRWVGIHGWLHHLGPLSAMLYSSHDVGPAGISRIVASPGLVARFPLGIRDKIRKRAVRPAGAKWLPARLTKVKITTGLGVKSARPMEREVVLALDDGSQRRVDHVLLGTGYDVDISRYSFLSPQLLRDLRCLDGSPLLTAGFSSSIPGLYFVGGAAARSFGPLLYFVAGTEFASRRVAAHIVRAVKTK